MRQRRPTIAQPASFVRTLPLQCLTGGGMIMLHLSCPLWLVILPTVIFAVPLSDFFEYNRTENVCISSGSSANADLNRSDCDTIVFPKTIDYAVSYDLDVTFPFFYRRITSLYANLNGFLSFNGMVTNSTPIPFPTGRFTVVATFWNYIDTRVNGGDVYLRPSTDPSDLNKASQEIRENFVDMPDFSATWIFVVSWSRVAYYPMGDLRNTFQIILVTDGVNSFAINNYQDDGINWSSVQLDEFGNGSTEVYAQAGFNDRYEDDYFLVPGSNTENIINISLTSNVGIPGKWIYRFTYPSIFISPPFLLQQLGGDFTLNCIPSDNISEIVWTRNDEIIDNDDNRITYLPNDRLRHILTISNASYTDDANYTCALNSSGILIDAQTSPVTIFRDVVNIFNEMGDQFVADAIINNMGYVGSGGSASGAGIPIMLHFTCITVSGHENATWLNPISAGEVNITYDTGTVYMSSVEVSITSDNFIVLLSCLSTDSQHFANVTITSEIPYLRVMGNSSILATVGSRPVLEFTVAVDSNGVEEFHSNVTNLLTFSLLSNSSSQTLPPPTMDANNFQRYLYVLPPVGIDTEGLYTLTINDTQGGFASVSIEVTLAVPMINRLPSLIIQQFGSRITLNCTPSNETIPIYWLKNGQPVLNATFLPNSTLKHVLIINSANMSDIGTYSCGLNMTGLPTNEQNTEVIVYRDAINIFNNGMYVENISVINEFTNSSNLTLTCTTIDGLGGPLWNMLSESGNAVVQNLLNISYMYSVLSLSNPTNDFAARFSCRSLSNSSLYKEVLITTENPYYNLLSDSSIFAPVASSPMIRIIIAINSDGTIAQQGNTTDSLIFTHTRDSITRSVEGLKPDPQNFQLYQYTFPPLRRSSQGDYRIQSSIVIEGRPQLNVSIRVDVNITGVELTRSFASVTLLEGNTVTISCIPNVTDVVLFWVYNDNGTNITESTRRISLSPAGINHELTIIDPVMADSGIYYCRTDVEDLIVEQHINVTIVPACKNEFSQALFWVNSRRGTEVTQPCSELHPSFRFGVSVGRRCQADGNWSPVDSRDCTMFRDSNPVVVVYYTTNQSNAIATSDIVNLIENSYEILNLMERTYNYDSSSGAELRSVTISFNLQQRTAPDDIVESITNILLNGNISLNLSEDFRVLAFQPSLNCTCEINVDDEVNNMLRTVCAGPSTAPCICSDADCECNTPTFVGNELVCGLDSDSDGFPDVELNCDDPSCQRDLCPEIYSVIDGEQSDSFCRMEVIPDDNRCPFEQDTTWNITWPATEVNAVATQKCPGGSEAEGFATRVCVSERQWGAPNVSECQTVEQIRLLMRAEELDQLVNDIFTSEDRDLTQTFESEVIVEITDDLADITNTTQPILPNDVTSASETLNIVLLATEIAGDEVNQESTMEVVSSAVDVLDSLFDERNDVSFQQAPVEPPDMMDMQQSAGEVLLENTERVAILFSTTLNATSNETVRSYLQGSGNNIIIETQIPTEEDLIEEGGVHFPPPTGDENARRFSNMTPTVEIPADLVIQRNRVEGRRVPIINSVSRNRNLPVGSSAIASMIISSQISTSSSPVFFDEGRFVTLTFNIEDMDQNMSLVPSCAFFNLTRGNFSDDGIEQIGINRSYIQCTSAHLTSFAVLVDVSGEGQDSTEESEALSIITFIGCGISIVCLAITIIALILLRKKIFNLVQHFVHLNLAIALLLGLITFVAGIERANEYRESCLAVAIMLHYFFMAAFCWMLCEGIVLFVLLHFVFYKGFFRSRKFFFLVGWGLPIPIVAISAGIAHEQYGINDRCWISEEEGAIWGFVGPMLLIILVNVFFLFATIYQIFKSKRSNMTAEEVTAFDTVKALVKAAFVLLPVLGSTWVFGLLAINDDTMIFVWIFTVLNSLQGVFIMILYVCRNDKFIKLVKSCGKDRPLTYTTSAKGGTVKTSTSGSRYVDHETVKNSLFSYNRIIREKYVTSDSYVATGDEAERQQISSPTNVFNAHSAADNYSFDEQDEMKKSASWNPSRSDSVLETISPSEYLKHQKQAIIAYVDINALVVEDETHL